MGRYWKNYICSKGVVFDVDVDMFKTTEFHLLKKIIMKQKINIVHTSKSGHIIDTFSTNQWHCNELSTKTDGWSYWPLKNFS